MKSGIEPKNKGVLSSGDIEKIGNISLQDVVSNDLLCVTHIGEDQGTSKQCWIRFLKQEYHSDFSILKKFLSAPETYAQIVNKESFVEIIKAEKKVIQDKIYIYLIMKKAEGLSLGKWYKQSSSTIDEKKEIAKTICDAFRQLHNKKIMHGGLSMDSIHVAEKGKIQIIDYCTTYPHIFDKTSENRSIEKLRYTPPEFFTGMDMSNFSKSPDIYSLGVIIHELSTGTPLFTQTTFSEIKHAICSPDLSHVDPNLLPALEQDPIQRYRSVDDLRDMIDKIDTGSANRRTDRLDSSKETELDIDPEEFIRKTIAYICKSAYFSSEQHEHLLLLLCEKFSSFDKASLNRKIHTIVKQMRMFDETLSKENLKRNIQISAKNSKISKRTVNRIINEAVNLGMKKTIAQTTANEEIHRSHLKVTFF